MSEPPPVEESPAQTESADAAYTSEELAGAKWYTLSFLLVASLLTLLSIVFFVWLFLQIVRQ